ncbi:MAG: SDR family NAD(P)-dependent oxidoreductase, partial [Treponema sp.]|nr:SDR family NAD(P)-dependent oxidoreductase [Treponema sp.]
NAGIFFFRDICNTTAESIEKIINLHILTATMLCRLFAGRMIDEKRPGYILNMSSIASWMMMPGIVLYSATKSYLHCFSRAMRHEVKNSGINITTVCPGAVATGLYNLAPVYLKLGVRFGIIQTPQKLARIALKKMFRKKARYIPGAILNRFFIFLVNILPEGLIGFLKRKIDSYGK